MLDAEFLKVLEYLDVIARKRFRGRERGERQGLRRGSSAEFLDRRPYSPGDDMRHLDWHVYHRFEELVTKLYREEENLDLQVMLDTSASMSLEGTRKREYALKLAAAIAYIGMSSMDRATIQPFSATLDEGSFTASGKGRVWELFSYLEGLEFGGRTSLATAAGQMMIRTRRRGVIVVISDFYDVTGIGPALRILRGRKNDVGVIHVTDPVEESPALRGELRLVDRETGDTREVTISQGLRERYMRAFAANRDRLQELARRYQLGAAHASTSEDFTELMVGIISRSGVVA